MHLKTYRANSVGQAMAMIRAELGSDALILSSRRVNGGVEIAACLDPQGDEAPPPSPPPPGHPRHIEPDPPPAHAHAHAHTHAPSHAHGANHAQWLPKPPARTSNARAGPDPLSWHGVPAAIALRLGSGPLAHALTDELQFGTLPLGEQAPLMLVGAPGAGKTLTTARLATRLVLAGHMPLVISADGRRAGAAEELAAYTRLLGIELVVASKAATIVRALPRRAAGAPVIIDTAGVNPFDPVQMEAILALAAASASIPVLVIAAGQDANEAAEQAEIFAAAAVQHLIPTRMDLARRLGAIVAAAHAGRMILSEAGTGPGATDGLTQLTPNLLADWLGTIPARNAPSGNHARGATPRVLTRPNDARNAR